MMREEFEQLTGFYPTAGLYTAIEETYTDFDGDKQTFCKAYKKNVNGMAEAIQRKCDMANICARINAEKETVQQIKELKDEIERLKATVEREQEWKPYESEHNVKQADYERLAECVPNGARYMSDDEAKDWIVQETGFARERITIVHELPVEEINRHRQIRRTGKMVDRRPIYDATDYHYIVFNVRANVTHGYEFWNDELQPYRD